MSPKYLKMYGVVFTFVTAYDGEVDLLELTDDEAVNQKLFRRWGIMNGLRASIYPEWHAINLSWSEINSVIPSLYKEYRKIEDEMSRLWDAYCRPGTDYNGPEFEALLPYFREWCAIHMAAEREVGRRRKN